jgi:hypothetical protein
LIYNSEIYTRKLHETSSSLGITGDLAMRPCENLPKHQGFKVYFDNFFSSLSLLKALKQNGILALGTIRQNRVRGAHRLLVSKNELQSSGRRSSDWKVDTASSTQCIVGTTTVWCSWLFHSSVSPLART